MSWTERRMLAFDVETTGADPREARIVQFALAEVGGSAETSEFSMLVNPGIEIPQEAVEIHGVTNELVREQGASAQEAVAFLVDAIKERAIEVPLVAFNARYDLTVLACEALRYGIEFDWSHVGFVIDPFVIDKHVHRYREGSRKLKAMCDHYGAILESEHEASSDAVAAARLAWVIGKKAKVIRRTRNPQETREFDELTAEWEAIRHDLAQLHAAQERWAAAQAKGLERHFAKQGKPQVVEADWPMLDPNPLPVPVASPDSAPQGRESQATLWTGRI